MPGWREVARTRAKPIRWVKESLRSRPAVASAWLSCARRRSSAATGSSRTVVAVGTERLSSMLATSRPAGPLISVPPGGPSETGSGAGLAPLPAATGVCSPATPLSNSLRHSGETEDGSRRNSSYRAWANPAFAVSNTFTSTKSLSCRAEWFATIGAWGKLTVRPILRRAAVGVRESHRFLCGALRGPPEFPGHQGGDHRGARHAMIGRFGRQMNPAGQYILHPLGQFAPDGVHDFGLEGRVARLDLGGKAAVGPEQVEEGGRLGAIVPEQGFHAD